MGYLFLAIALLAGSAKGFCGKRVSRYTATYSDAAFINSLRMTFCAIIRAIIMLIGNRASPLSPPTAQLILISLLSGISTAAFVILWLVSVKTGAYVMLDVFLMLGVGATVALCFAFLGEPIRITQVIGFVILVAAAFVMLSYNGSLKGKSSPIKFILLIGCGIANGLTDFSQKLFSKTVSGASVAEFSLYTYISAALVLLVALLVFSIAERRNPPVTDAPRAMRSLGAVLPYVALLSAFLFVNSYFKTLAASYLDSAILYPLSQGASLVLSMLMAAIFFKERITRKCLVGVALAISAMLILNI